MPAKTAALAAHATQLTVGPTGRAFALSNNLALPIVAQEHYILAAGAAGDRDERGWETDLLAGLDLDRVRHAVGFRAGSHGRNAMDPDLDQNQQHWQDRLDSFQWVLMSIVSQLDSVPT